MADTVLVHPNRDKAEAKATKAVVILLLVTSAALILIITLGGWSELQGMEIVSFLYAILYLVMAFFVARWNRGVLPVAAGLAILFAVVAAVAGPAWFERDKAGFDDPDAGALDPRPPDDHPRARAAALDRLRHARLPAAVEHGDRGLARRGRPLRAARPAAASRSRRSHSRDPA